MSRSPDDALLREVLAERFPDDGRLRIEQAAPTFTRRSYLDPLGVGLPDTHNVQSERRAVLGRYGGRHETAR